MGLLAWIQAGWTTVEQHPGLTICARVELAPGSQTDPNIFNWHITFMDSQYGHARASGATVSEAAAKTAVEVAIARYRKKRAA